MFVEQIFLVKVQVKVMVRSRRFQLRVPSPVKIVRLPPLSFGHQRVLRNVLVQGGGATFLSTQDNEIGCLAFTEVTSCTFEKRKKTQTQKTHS